MIELRVAAGECAHVRFACSPIAEVIWSLHALHSGRVHALHRDWAQLTRPRLRGCDTEVLRAFVPGLRFVPSPPSGCLAGNAIEEQLQFVADWPADLLRSELQDVWSGAEMPPAARQLIADGGAGPRRLADALGQYWDLALRPYWGRFRTVLDAEVLYQAQRLAERGIIAMMAALHPRLELRGQALYVHLCSQGDAVYDLNGQNLLLIPSVFSWPNLRFDPGNGGGAPSLLYGPRGIGTIWETAPVIRAAGDPLGAMLGPARAAILRGTETPKSTTELARELGSGAPAVSEHLAVLKRCGMVVSWRSGRSVLYARTPLATSVITAAGRESSGQP
jgi:DNA-binding transcriptional ArsR family regulator